MSDLHILHGVAVSSTLSVGREGIRSTLEPDLHLEVADEKTPPEELTGEVLLSFALDDEQVYLAVATDHGYTLRVFGMCDFQLDPSIKMARCIPHAGSDQRLLPLIVRGAFLAFVLGLRGECVLHASAVELDGAGIAFVGPSGTGKSTLAGWACARGATFVSDDLLRIPPGSSEWLGRSPELRMREGAFDILTPYAEEWGVAESVDGRRTAAPPTSGNESGTIDAVVIPRPSRQATTVSVRRLDPIEGSLAITASPRLQGWRYRPVLEAHLDAACHLADHSPVCVATVPWGPPFAAAAMDELLSQVMDIARAGVV